MGFWFFPLRLERLRDRLIPVAISGIPMPTLPPEDLLLVLCAHGGRHQWERVSWICDIAQVIHTQPELDWQPVLERAQQFHRQRSLLLGLWLAHDLLGAQLPDSVCHEIQADPIVRQLAVQVQARLFSATHIGDTIPFRFYHQLRERRADGLRDTALYLLYKGLLRLVPSGVKDE